MSKLSEPVAKALQALLKASRGDVMVVTRTITGNFCAEDYFHNLVDEIKLLRCANFDDILIALVEGLPQAIKTTEQPSAAAAVEGILTEEELKEPLGDAIGLYIGLYEGIEKSNLPKSTILKHIQILLAEVKRSTKAEANYLSANAELSFKNNYLQKENERLDKIEVVLASHNNRMFNSLKSIAESSTNLADSLRIQANLTLEAFRI